MGKFVIEHTPCLVIKAHGILPLKTPFYPPRTVAYTHMVARSILLTHSVILLQGVEDGVELGHVGIFRASIESLKHT